jgi:SAM-dependent methyltransferase
MCAFLVHEAEALSPQPRALKPVSFWERAFAQGRIIGVNGYRVNQARLRLLLTQEGYHLRETPHFWVGTRGASPTLIIHWLAPEAIDADLGRVLLEEVQPLGLLPDERAFAEVFGALVGSVFPRDPLRAWRLFGANTLRRYRQLLAETDAEALPAESASSHMACFATLYRRVCELMVGASVLEAGCSFGFFALVLAERRPDLARIVGVDREMEPFAVARALAAERHMTNIAFVQADLLTDEVRALGRFSTVTALHVLEHFPEAQMYGVLTTLFAITEQRLILAVPYEAEAEAAYGHQQRFSRARLEAVGRWCQEQLGAGRGRYEECAGGLLVVERDSAAPVG